MGKRPGNWADRLAELCGSSALAGGLGASAWLVAPLTTFSPVALVGLAASLGGLVGWLIVHAAPAKPAKQSLPLFEIDSLADLTCDPPRFDELLLLEEGASPAETSRVVQLFGPASTETPGALQARIAAHLGDTSRAFVPVSDEPQAMCAGSPHMPDASEALHAALAEIRRSLATR